MYHIKFLTLLTIIFLLESCAVKAPSLYIPAHEPPAYRLAHIHPRVILVLGSGSARGFAHAGVLNVLSKNHIPIDMIVGTSAGSIVGALYADHPSAARLQKILLTTPRKDVIDYSLLDIGNGIISGNQLQQFLVKTMRAKYFEHITIPLAVVATNLATGDIHVFASGPIAPAVNASSAAPPYFQPVKLYGSTYIDGGLADPVAVDVARRFHPKMIIAVSLNPPLSKNIPASSPGVFLRGVSIMLSRLNRYSAAEADVVIEPEQDEIDMFDGTRRLDFIHAGEKAARKALPKIKALLRGQV
jgi:NTE family protein